MDSRWSPVVPQVGTANPNVKPLAQAFGDRYTGHVRPDAVGENVAPAGLWSTAPYRAPAVHCAGNNGKCRATILVAGTEYCVGHARGLGLIPNWSTKKKVHQSAETYREPNLKILGTADLLAATPVEPDPEPQPEPEPEPEPVIEVIPYPEVPTTKLEVEPVLTRKRRTHRIGDPID